MSEKVIKLRSNSRRISHYLYRLTPLSSNTIAYRYETEFLPIHLHNNRGDYLGMEFHCGPLMLIGEVDNQTGMKLIEITRAKDKETGKVLYPVLIFEEVK